LSREPRKRYPRKWETAIASGWAEAFTHAIKERDKGNAQALDRILAAITEQAGDLQTATRILRERVEADERAIVDEAVRMMAEKKQSRTADWHWSSAALQKGQRY